MLVRIEILIQGICSTRHRIYEELNSQSQSINARIRRSLIPESQMSVNADYTELTSPFLGRDNRSIEGDFEHGNDSI